MARTITEIYEGLIAEKQAMASLADLAGEGSASYAAGLLADLSSRSRVAVWRMLFYVVAVCAWTVEKLMDSHRAEVAGLAAASIAGTSDWLVQQAKLFELGNASLAVDADRKVVYVISNPASRIIKYAAASREYGRTVLKLAKDSGGLPVVLDDTELAQVRAYIAQIQFAGTKLAVVSRAADKLKVSGEIYYNGLLNPAGILTDIQAAVAAYLAEVPFDTAISLEGLTDAIQNVVGVKDLVLSFYGMPNSGTAYGAALSGPTWLPFAGYAVLDVTDLNFVVS